MRAAAVAGFVACVGGCAGGCASLPGMKDPRWTLEPRVDFPVIDGKLEMQSPGPSGPVGNAELEAGSSFGLTNRHTNLWGRVSVGDGYSGFSFDWIDQEHTSEQKQLRGNFGVLTSPQTVPVKTEIDGYRLSLAYHAVSPPLRLGDVNLRGGLGLSLDHESFELTSFRIDRSQTQRISAKDDGVPMVRARLDAEYDVFGVRVDFGWMEGDFGDVDGRSTDLEISARYRVTERVMIVGGFKRLELPLKGREGGLVFDLDLDTESWFVGIAFEL